MTKESAPIRSRSELSFLEQLKKDRMSRIFGPSGNTIITALDDSSISGPEHRLRDMRLAVDTAINNGTNAILGFSGMFRRHPDIAGKTAGIINLTLSTEGPYHLRKVLVDVPEQVDRLSLAGASVHVNTTSPWESEMLSILGQTAVTCDELGIPLLAHVYPRTIKDGKEYHYQDLKEKDPEAYAKLVRHGARIAADLGADIIKVPFTGTAESFRTVVESTYGVPVVMAGGPIAPVQTFIEEAHAAIEAGARGIAVGRNYFERPFEFKDEDELVLIALYRVVHMGQTAKYALAVAESINFGRKLSELKKLSQEELDDLNDLASPRSYNPFFALFR